MTRLRVLVAEDSLTVRRRLIEALGRDPEIEVVGEAPDGQRAIELAETLRPDVMTLDMVMPIMSGVTVTEYVMAYCPIPILIVSASTNRAELFKTYEALAAGALDALEKPLADERNATWDAQLIRTVKLIARIKVITHPRARLSAARFASTLGSLDSRSSNRIPRVIAIGASTGGPAALRDLLSALPARFPVPILIVLHIGSAFAVALAEWLDGQCALSVAYAKDGDLLSADVGAQVLLAPPDRHLIVRQGRLWLTDDRERHFCRPSVDVLFESLARELGSECAACLLTGMGSDGAEGLLAIRKAGGKTIAQNEATSVVFGMPKEAILLGAAEQILPLGEIAPALIALGGSATMERSP